jgi:hypothetical protein
MAKIVFQIAVNDFAFIFSKLRILLPLLGEPAPLLRGANKFSKKILKKGGGI